MTHHREKFERIYALTEAVAPANLIRESDDATADRFLVLKDISFAGLSRMNRMADAWQRVVPFSRKDQVIASLLDTGGIAEVRVEGWKGTSFVLGSHVETLLDLAAGRVPPAWTPLESDTTAEVVFLAPLDPVSARGRAKELFGFDFVWEVYKPAGKRKYGYYALPVLWGDRLVARFDSKLDRTTNTFVVLGLWLEDAALGTAAAFAEALGRGFARFVAFLGAEHVDVSAIEEPLLRRAVQDSNRRLSR